MGIFDEIKKREDLDKGHIDLEFERASDGDGFIVNGEVQLSEELMSMVIAYLIERVAKSRDPVDILNTYAKMSTIHLIQINKEQ